MQAVATELDEFMADAVPTFLELNNYQIEDIPLETVKETNEHKRMDIVSAFMAALSMTQYTLLGSSKSHSGQ